MLGQDLKDSLAGLIFNVRSAKGLEILLTESIASALKDPKADDLKALAKKHGKGFWAVLEIVAATRWGDSTAADIGLVASCLATSELLDGYTGPERSTVLSGLADTAKTVKDWIPLTEEIANGVCDLLVLQNDEAFAKKQLRSIFGRLKKDTGSSDQAAPIPDTIAYVIRILETAQRLDMTGAIPKTISVPYADDAWAAVCSSLNEEDREGVFWERFTTTSGFENVAEHLKLAISNQSFGESQLTTLRITHQSATQCNWSGMIAELNEKLNANQSTTDATAFLIFGLFELARLGESNANEVLSELVDGGHLAHHYQTITTANGRAAIILATLIHNPGLSAPPAVGQSSNGHSALTTMVRSENEEVAQELRKIATRFGWLGPLIKPALAENRVHALLAKTMKIEVDSGDLRTLFSSEDILSNWTTLRELIADGDDNVRFQSIIRDFARTQALCGFIEQNNRGFNADDSPLYLEILRRARGETPSFVAWCKEGLQSLGEDDWKEDLEGSNLFCALCLELSDQDNHPDLSTNFSDALQDHAKAVVNGDSLPVEWIRSDWSRVVNCITSQAIRKVLCTRVLETAVSADGDISSEFFEMYGELLQDKELLSKNDQVLSHFFTSLVREKNLAGLKWLSAFLEKETDFIDAVSAKHTAKEFLTRLQVCLSEEGTDDAQQTIERIAQLLGIESTQEAEKESNDTSTGED